MGGPIQIIDTDTHLQEPPDLWTSRMSPKWGELIPCVKWDEVAGEEAWFIGDQRVIAVGVTAQAGWPGYWPEYPKHFSDVDPATWDAKERLKLMDRYGIHAQTLYSNVALFHPAAFKSQASEEFIIECIKVYNDYQTEWSSIAPNRLLPMTILPFWDLDATISEMERCASMGHKGVVFSQEPGFFGLAPLADPYWDPLWGAAQEMGLPINFHTATAAPEHVAHDRPSVDKVMQNISTNVSLIAGNIRTIGHLITGGICHRFPNLNFVSVESGIGWIPFCLEALDWQWKNQGILSPTSIHPEYDLLPSEYFQRQIYGCFWFEEASAHAALEILGPDNFLYETDFPHPTSMSPGPASVALPPDEYLSRNFADVPETSMRKILHDNAARIYHLSDDNSA